MMVEQGQRQTVNTTVFNQMWKMDVVENLHPEEHSTKRKKSLCEKLFTQQWLKSKLYLDIGKKNIFL